MLNELCPASDALRHVTVMPLCLQLTPFMERALTNLVPRGSTSVTTTLWAGVALSLAAVRVTVKREPRRTDFGALAFVAVSTTRDAVFSPSTPPEPPLPPSPFGNPGCTGAEKLHWPLDGPSLTTRSWRSA